MGTASGGSGGAALIVTVTDSNGNITVNGRVTVSGLEGLSHDGSEFTDT